MIDQVYIIAGMGKAMYRNSEGYFVVDANDLEAPKPCNAEDLTFFQSHWNEVLVQKAEDLPVDELRAELAARTQAQQVLEALYLGMDADTPPEDRAAAIAAAESGLAEADVRRVTCFHFFAEPLPASANLDAARTAAQPAPRVRALYHKVERIQPALGQYNRIWNQTAPRFLEIPEDYTLMAWTLRAHGVSAALVQALERRDEPALRAVVRDYAQNPDLKWSSELGVSLLEDMVSQLIATSSDGTTPAGSAEESNGRTSAMTPAEQDGSAPLSHPPNGQHSRSAQDAHPGEARPPTKSVALPVPRSTQRWKGKGKPGGRKQGDHPIGMWATYFVLGFCLLLSAVSLGLLLFAENLLTALVVTLVSVMVNSWGLYKSDRGGFVKVKETRRAYEPPRHFSEFQTLLLIVIIMSQVGAVIFAITH